jgi:NAD(P)-dependent dehydrogenase (short-subunit alcohol dehydrogenase family)
MLGSTRPVATIDGKEFNKILTLNLLANQAMIAAFDPMLRKEPGRAAPGGHLQRRPQPRAYWGAYGASKAALETLVLSYADEVRSFGPPRSPSSIPAPPPP